MDVGVTPSLMTENKPPRTLMALAACGRAGIDAVVGMLPIAESRPLRRFSGSTVSLGFNELAVVGRALPAPRSESKYSRRFREDVVGNRPGNRGVATGVAVEPGIDENVGPRPRAENRSPKMFRGVVVWV